MRARTAIGLALLLPVGTVPWFFVGLGGALWGVPWWVVYSLAATIALALAIAFGLTRSWERLADEAEAVRQSDATDPEGSR